MDISKVVTSTAKKLARLVYLMITRGEAYVDQGQHYDEERYREQAVRGKAKKAAELGMPLTPAASPARTPSNKTIT